MGYSLRRIDKAAEEAEIIDASIDNPKCDNEKDGARSLNDTMASSDKYMVYVVWR